jgi:hypothetical protein
MDKIKLGALRTQIQQASDRDVRIEETAEETRTLTEIELSLAGGGDEIPQW